MTDKICNHCGVAIELRNPSGYCDHLHYPENCKVCNGEETHEENFLKKIVKLLVDNGEIIQTDNKHMILHEGKKFYLSVKEMHQENAECPFCNTGFWTTEHLELHIKSRHPEKMK